MRKIPFFSLFVLKVMAILFLNGCQTSKERTDALITESIYYIAEQQAERIAGLINSDLRVLKTLSNIMGDYEKVPEEQRRDLFDDMLYRVVANEENIGSLYMVWKPNVLDEMDSVYIGRHGSSPTGQYAISCSKESGYILLYGISSEKIEKIMATINGFKADWQIYVDNPAPLIVFGKNTYGINMMIPIVNSRTSEVVGAVGFNLDVKVIQPVIEKTVNSFNVHKNIIAMAVYSSNGTTIGSIFPERIGKILSDEDIPLYGDNILPIYNTVVEGKYYNFKSFTSLFRENVEIVMVPFSIGIDIGYRHDTTWTVMIVSMVEL
jgi:methyl-accepting chemotaxis protein